VIENFQAMAGAGIKARAGRKEGDEVIAPGFAATGEDPRVLRILIAHADAATRGAIDQALRRTALGPVAIYQAPSLLAGLRNVSRIDPHVVLVDISEDRDLALEMAREARRPGRLIIGLYSPLAAQEREGDLFRRAARAGFGDFVPLPAAEDELAAALRAVEVGTGPAGATERAEGRVVAVVGHKGGVGTSTLAVNLALALSASGRVASGVALCDASLQFGSVSALLGVVPEVDLVDLVRDLDEPEALFSYLTFEPKTRLAILAGPRDPRAAERISPEDLGRVLIALRRRFGLVVVDTPTPLDLLSLAVLDLAETIVLVTEALAPTVVASAIWLDLLAEQGFARERLRVVLNRHSSAPGTLSERTVAEHLGRPIDLVVPEHEAVRPSGATGSPMFLAQPKTAFSQAVGRLAEAMLSGSARTGSATLERSLRG
jgi:pilus assembly protein CpaE